MGILFPLPTYQFLLAFPTFCFLALTTFHLIFRPFPHPTYFVMSHFPFNPHQHPHTKSILRTNCVNILLIHAQTLLINLLYLLLLLNIANQHNMIILCFLLFLLLQIQQNSYPRQIKVVVTTTLITSPIQLEVHTQTSNKSS